MFIEDLLNALHVLSHFTYSENGTHERSEFGTQCSWYYGQNHPKDLVPHWFFHQPARMCQTLCWPVVFSWWLREAGILVSIFQMRKLRSGEVKSLAAGHSGGGIWAHIEPLFWRFNASVLFPKLQSFLYTLKIFHIYVLPGTVSQLMFFLNLTHFFKIRALLRYNPHTIWFIHLKCTVQITIKNGSSNSSSEYLSEENENTILKRYLPVIFITALFLIPVMEAV